MTWSSERLPLLAGANSVCVAVSIAIVYFAFRDWPARYVSHRLSWSVVLFFLLFVGMSAVGVIATGLYARSKNRLFLRAAVAPAVLLGAGLALGLLKAALTGDF